MAKGHSSRASSRSSSGGRAKSGSSARTTSAARLHQKSGSSNSFGGYTKVNHNNGTFSMRRTEE